jgi:hypothetical protein
MGRLKAKSPGKSSLSVNQLHRQRDQDRPIYLQKTLEILMLSSTALIWTMIAAAVCWFVAINQIYALWRMVGDKSSTRHWSVTQGKITISRLGVSPTHPSGRDPADAGAVMRYHYRVGAKDHEGDGIQIGGKSRTMGLIAKALIKKYPEGRKVDVYYDPADPTKSALERKGQGNLAGTIVFLVVFGAIAGILTAHALAGKMIMMPNGLPMFALGLPSAALLIAVGSFAAYFIQRRERKASASWPAVPGQIVSSRTVEEEERRRDDDGREHIDRTYRPEIRFTYRVDGNDYATDTWKPGGTVGSGSPKYAEGVVARYAAGQSVQVYYDPAHPDVAVLEPANRDGAALPLVFGVAFGLAGTLFMWLFTHGHWVNAATGV